MPNGTYGGVRGKGAKAKTLAPRPTRFIIPVLSSIFPLSIFVVMLAMNTDFTIIRAANEVLYR